MRSVVITRPASPTSDRAHTDALSTTLMQAGLTTYHLPTLSLTALHSPEDEIRISYHWQKYTAVMLVSQHAAQFAHQHMTRLGLSWSPNTWLAAVGQGTLHTLQQLWPQHHRHFSPTGQDDRRHDDGAAVRDQVHAGGFGDAVGFEQADA